MIDTIVKLYLSQGLTGLIVLTRVHLGGPMTHPEDMPDDYLDDS